MIILCGRVLSACGRYALRGRLSAIRRPFYDGTNMPRSARARGYNADQGDRIEAIQKKVPGLGLRFYEPKK